MLTNPVAIRRAEALAVFLLGLTLYYLSCHSWWTFALLFFLPDVGAAGYLISHKAGSSMYNLTHWAIWPILLGGYGLYTNQDEVVMVAIIWITHVAFDRMLGWGLKTGGSFYETDMGLKKALGQREPAA